MTSTPRSDIYKMDITTFIHTYTQPEGQIDKVRYCLAPTNVIVFSAAISNIFSDATELITVDYDGIIILRQIDIDSWIDRKKIQTNIQIYTGCSLNIVLFPKILKYSGLWPFSVFPWCQCAYANQVGTSAAVELAEFRKITKF